jgi:hypothetical protein
MNTQKCNMNASPKSHQNLLLNEIKRMVVDLNPKKSKHALIPPIRFSSNDRILKTPKSIFSKQPIGSIPQPV